MGLSLGASDLAIVSHSQLKPYAIDLTVTQSFCRKRFKSCTVDLLERGDPISFLGSKGNGKYFPFSSRSLGLCDALDTWPSFPPLVCGAGHYMA